MHWTDKEILVKYLASNEWVLKRTIRKIYDNFSCQDPLCQHPGAPLQVHHLSGKYGAEELDDLITLCLYCHYEQHPKGSFGHNGLRPNLDEFGKTGTTKPVDDSDYLKLFPFADEIKKYSFKDERISLALFNQYLRAADRFRDDNRPERFERCLQIFLKQLSPHHTHSGDAGGT
jgi:hypothetical protein